MTPNKSIPKSLFILIIIGSVLFSACKDKKDKITPDQVQRRPPPMKVDVFVVHPRTISETLEVSGTLLANEITDIQSEVSGRVVSLNINEGHFVSKGVLLAKLYDGDLQAQLSKLQVQLKIAEETEKRQAQLLKIQGISQQDYDLSLLSVNNIKADIEIIKTSISKTEIRAPFSGKLGLKNISPGAYISPQVVITTITQTDPLKLDFTIPEKYTDKVKNGQTIRFTVQGRNKEFTAKVIATEVRVEQTTRSLLIRSVVQNRNAELVPGTFAKVLLNFDPDPNALMVPTEAIIPEARGKKIVRFNGGNSDFVDVTTGVRDSAFVQVTEGIKSGDTVIITGLLSVRPGMKVQLGNITSTKPGEVSQLKD